MPMPGVSKTRKIWTQRHREKAMGRQQWESRSHKARTAEGCQKPGEAQTDSGSLRKEPTLQTPDFRLLVT